MMTLEGEMSSVMASGDYDECLIAAEVMMGEESVLEVNVELEFSWMSGADVHNA